MFSSTRVQELLSLDQRVGLPSLKSCDGAKLRAEVVEVNRDIKRIQTHKITVLSNLQYESCIWYNRKNGAADREEKKKN